MELVEELYSAFFQNGLILTSPADNYKILIYG